MSSLQTNPSPTDFEDNLQLDVDAKILKGLKLCSYSVAVIYAKHWFKAPVCAEAAANDLQ